MKYLSAAVLSFITATQLANAHPTGHEGGFAQTAQHILQQPDHLAMIAGLGLIAALLAWKLSSKRRSSGKH